MIGILIKVLFGLFVYIALPSLICKKQRYKKNTWQYFVKLACQIIGVLLICYAAFDFIKLLFNFKLS